MTHEFRSAEVRGTDETKRQLVIVPVTYDRVDTYNTTWDPDVFTASLERRMADKDYPQFTWRHDPDPIGHICDYEQTPKELRSLVQLDDFDAVPTAKRAFAQYRSGTLRDVSVEFARQSDKADPAVKGATRITKADLVAVGAVMDGSVPGARYLGSRSGTPGMIERAVAVDLAHRLHAGSVTLRDVLVRLGLDPEEVNAEPVAVVLDAPPEAEVAASILARFQG